MKWDPNGREMQYLAHESAKKRSKDVQLARTRNRKQKYGGNRKNELVVPDFLLDFNTIYGPLFAILWPLQTTSGCYELYACVQKTGSV